MSVDVAALQAQVTALQTQLAQLAPPPPPQTYAPAPAPEAARPQAIYALVGRRANGYLDPDPREVRRLVESIALSKRAPSPTQTIPPDWLPALRLVAEARTKGFTWREALVEANLEVPVDLETLTQAVRGEMNALWDSVLAVTGCALDGANDVVRDSLKDTLRRSLS